MPEGHSVHRIARQFDRNFVGRVVHASSPQGRFAEGAAEHRRAHGDAMPAPSASRCSSSSTTTSGCACTSACTARGTSPARSSWMPTIASANGRMGQTNQRGTVPRRAEPRRVVFDRAGENSLTSIGAPRRTRHCACRSRRRGSPTTTIAAARAVGQVRLRLLTDMTCADLRGPTACEVCDPDEVEADDREARPRSARRRRRRGRGAVHRASSAASRRRSACCSWTRPS